MGEEFYFATITTRDCSLWDWKRGRNEEWIKEKEQRTLGALENLSSKSEAEINRIFDGFINGALEMNDEAFRIDGEGMAKKEDVIELAGYITKDFYNDLKIGRYIGCMNTWHQDGKMRVMVIAGDVTCGEMNYAITNIIRFGAMPEEILEIGGWD